MSQPSSSIVSADHPEIKYKKALKEISKLISANRALRETSDKGARQFKDKIDQLALRYDDLEKEYEILRKQKQSMAPFIEQIQENNEELRKERKNLQRELGYLNDVLAEQNAEIKKIHTYKDERALANLIRTYEDKETIMDRNRNQQQELISKLKDNLQRLENQLGRQKSLREELQDKYNRLVLQINKYKELNSTLMNQNERILQDHSSKETFTIEKEKQLELLANQFKRQINNLKNSKQEITYDQVGTQYNQTYQEILNQKNQLVLQLARVRDAFEEAQQKERQFYDMQQKLKYALNKADRATEQLNMLKSKIVVLEAKQFLEEAGEDEYNQKQFQERLSLMISQNDPLQSIKNGEDNSHFKLLKSFILDLQDKIYKINSEKKDLSRKYKSIKGKFVKNAEQLTIYEDQNKLLKGKVEGYERLTQKLQYELEKSLHINEEQITKITLTSNNLITKKSEQYKATIALLNSQLEMQNDKANRTERNLKQEIETLKLELGSIKIKFKDISDRSNQDTQFIDLYKKRNDELSHKLQHLEEEVSDLQENIGKYEHLLKEEKGKSEGLIIQKQQLNSQIKQLCEELDRKSYQLGENSKMKEDHYQYEVKRISNQNKKLREELQYSSKELSIIQREMEERRGRDKSQVEEISRLTMRNRQLEESIINLKKYIREVEDEKETLRIRAEKFQQTFEKANTIEEELMNKNDLLNDLKRQILVYENDLKAFENQLQEEKRQNESLKKELSNLKMKTLEASHDIKKDYESKTLESKRTIQNLNQEISELTAEVREEKTKNSRMANELNTAKSQKNRLQEIIEQNRRKEFQIEGQTGNFKIQISNLNMDNEKLKNQIKTLQNNTNSLNQEIEELQQKIFTLNQEVSGLKMKLQTAEDSRTDLMRDLTTLKNHISEVQNYLIKLKTASNPTWEQQCFTSSLSQIVHKLRKFCRYYDIGIENKGPSISLPVSANHSAKKTDFNISSIPNESSQFKSYTKIGMDENISSFTKSPIKSTIRVINSSQKTNARVFQQSDSSGGIIRNFGTSQSLEPGSIDYTYSSSSKIGSYGNQEISGTYGESSEWMNPSYPISHNNYSESTQNYKGFY